MTYLDLLNIKYKKRGFLLFLTILFIVLVIYILNIKIYDTYNALGYFQNKKLITKVSILDPDTINDIKYVVINNKKYKAKVSEVGKIELDEDSMITYQSVVIECRVNLYENQVVKIVILSNKEKVYKKLKNMLF